VVGLGFLGREAVVGSRDIQVEQAWRTLRALNRSYTEMTLAQAGQPPKRRIPIP
jgi:hypothetical protein